MPGMLEQCQYIDISCMRNFSPWMPDYNWLPSTNTVSKYLCASNYASIALTKEKKKHKKIHTC